MEVDKFFSALSKIRDNHSHMLITVLNKTPTLNISSKSWQYKYKAFNLKDFPTVEEPAADGGGSAQHHLNWKVVFDWIDNHYGKGEIWSPGDHPSQNDAGSIRYPCQ